MKASAPRPASGISLTGGGVNPASNMNTRRATDPQVLSPLRYRLRRVRRALVSSAKCPRGTPPLAFAPPGAGLSILKADGRPSDARGRTFLPLS